MRTIEATAPSSYGQAVTADGRALLADALGDEHEDLRKRLRTALLPWDDEAMEFWEVAGHLPAGAFAALGRAGVFRERWASGAVFGLPYTVVMAEELAARSAGLALATMTHCEVFTGALHRLARTPWQRSLLEEALKGRAIGCFAATESGAGSDIGAVSTSASRIEGGWQVKGEKRFIGNVGTATHALVTARTTDGPRGRDLGLIIVPLGSPGVEVVGYYSKAGLHSCDTGDLRLETLVPEDALLGVPGAGLLYVTRLLFLERISVSCQALTAARISLRLACSFARQRVAFGEPVMAKQAIRHRLAAAQVDLWAAESYLEQVVGDALAGADVSHRAAGLKAFCTERAGEVVDICLQVFGGRGYLATYPIERCWRDLRASRIGGGSDEVMYELVGSLLERPDAHFDNLVADLGSRDGPDSSRRAAQADLAAAARLEVAPVGPRRALVPHPFDSRIPMRGHT